MKSRFFTDTQGLDDTAPPRDKVCVCLCLNRRLYEKALRRAQGLRMTSGEYVERLILSDGGTAAKPSPDSPPQRLPPAPPGH